MLGALPTEISQFALRHLTDADRIRVRLVCRHWCELVDSPNVWPKYPCLADIWRKRRPLGERLTAEWVVRVFALPETQAWNALQASCGRGDLEGAKWVAERLGLKGRGRSAGALARACTGGHYAVSQWVVDTFHPRRLGPAFAQACMSGNQELVEWIAPLYDAERAMTRYPTRWGIYTAMVASIGGLGPSGRGNELTLWLHRRYSVSRADYNGLARAIRPYLAGGESTWNLIAYYESYLRDGP